MARWVRVAGVDELSPGQGRTFRQHGFAVAIFRHDGAYYALEDGCPHQGASLGEGLFHEGRVICPLHSWIFDVRTGECPRGSHAPARTYPVRCDGDAVEVQIPEH